MPNRRYEVTTSYFNKSVGFIYLVETPWLWSILETVAEKFCSWVLRDRWCSRVAGPAMVAAEKRSMRHQVLITREQAIDIYKWHGWDTPFLEDEETDKEVDE